VDMIWSIDIELDELVMESKSSEGTSGNEHQRNGEKDKQVVADLVKKLLVREAFNSFVRNAKIRSQAAGILQPGPCRERLDSGLVFAAGLSFDKSYWDKREVRTRTSLLLVLFPLFASNALMCSRQLQTKQSQPPARTNGRIQQTSHRNYQ